MSIEWTADGRPQGPSHHLLSPLYLSPRQGSPTIRRSGPPSPCIVGAGEDVEVGMGPLWPPAAGGTAGYLSSAPGYLSPRPGYLSPRQGPHKGPRSTPLLPCPYAIAIAGAVLAI